jgi:hypothetical protein
VLQYEFFFFFGERLGLSGAKFSVFSVVHFEIRKRNEFRVLLSYELDPVSGVFLQRTRYHSRLEHFSIRNDKHNIADLVTAKNFSQLITAFLFTCSLGDGRLVDLLLWM